MKKIVLLIILLAGVAAGCGEGLSPTDAADDYGRTVFGGTVYFTGKRGWPSADSLKDIRVVGFKKFPPDDLLNAVLNGEAYFTESSLDFYVDSAEYEIEIKDAPVGLEYIAVAQQFGGLYDWKVIGVFSDTEDFAPDGIFLEKGEKRMDIDITVDFSNEPPQPF